MNKLISLEELFNYIDERNKNDLKTIIAIDGNACGGKTTLSELLKEKFESTIIHIDDFYKPRNKNTFLDLNSTEGNINYSRFKNEIIDKLNGGELIYKKFNCSTQTEEKAQIIRLNKLIIVEGTYSINPRLNRYFDASVFVKISDELQKIRLKKRNPNNYDSFLNTWVKLERNYFDEFDIISICDYIIDGSNLI